MMMVEPDKVVTVTYGHPVVLYIWKSKIGFKKPYLLRMYQVQAYQD